MTNFKVVCQFVPIVQRDTRIVILDLITRWSNFTAGTLEKAVMMQTRTLVVDDETPSRRHLTSLLDHETDFEVVGECAEAGCAVQAILDLQPDLVFLDVQMPRMSGFEVLKAVEGKRSPAVIFVTDSDQFAIQAFDAQAVDCLLKPFRLERFQESLQRVRQGAAKRGSPPMQAPEKSAPDRMVVKSGDRLLFVPYDELDFIRASANYVRLHLGRTIHVVRQTINAMESCLPAERFVRIHRSYLVNLSAVREIYHAGGGEYIVALRSGRQLPVGPTYPAAIRRALSTSSVPRFGTLGGI
jgi:two-component system, LytTR family, response regulator